MRRREFIALLGAGAAWPLTARSQPARTYRIGVLGSENAPVWEGLRQGLRDLGYDDGRNVTIEWRWSEGRAERLRVLAGELVDQKVDVVVTSGTQAAWAAKQATTTIPIVMANASYPDKIGLVAAYARPGGNVTGLSNVAPELMGKRLDLLKEIVPKTARVAVFVDLGNPIAPLAFQELLAAAAVIGMKIEPVDVRNPDDFSSAFRSVASNLPEALYAFGTPVNFKGRKLLVDFAAENRIPSIYEEKLFVETGGLMSYGPSFTDLFRRAATYVDKILKGQKPDDLPVEQPTKFELFINLKTAQALGLNMPPTLLARADEVIE